MIFFTETNEIKNAEEYLDNISDEELFKKFKRDCANKKILCNLCKEKVFVKKRHDTNLRFMSHHSSKNSKKKKCDNFDTAKYDKFGARSAIYYGEGSIHEELINFVINMLHKEEDFCNPKAESYIFSKMEKYENGIRKRKKPDIQVDYSDTKIALEIQLSYQLDIDFFERESFYENNKMFLIWFFYELKKCNFKESDKMIFWNNNENAYVITEETKEKSINENKLYFWCYYNEYIWEDEKVIKPIGRQKMITFKDLTYDTIRKKVYYKDVFVEKLKLKILKAISIDDKHSFNNEIKDDILHLCGFYPKDQSEFVRLLKIIFSLKEGEILGFRFYNYIALLNNFFYNTKGYEMIVFRAIDRYNRNNDIYKHKKIDSFKKKVQEFRKERWTQNTSYNTIVYILFPELF